MSIQFADGVRSVLMFQCVVQVVLVVTAILLLLGTECPRPGRYMGIVATGIATISFILYVISETIDDFGKAFGLQLTLALIAVYLGSLGFTLLIMHLVFHSNRVFKRLERLFKHETET